LRGWYIKGDGVARSGEGDDHGREDRDAREHPLVILSAGFPYSIAFDQPVGGIAVGKQLRKTITYLVGQGYDVLFFDKRGHGYSEGILDGMGEDIFRALDQLERGTLVEDGITLSLSIITPDGRRLNGAAAAAERLLGDRLQCEDQARRAARLLLRIQPAAKSHGDELFESPSRVSIQKRQLR
jgi:pimeloyl-ACP methyl ester carboxylesterase